MRELAGIIRAPRDANVTIPLVPRNMKLAQAAGDELHVTVKGRMVHAATPERFRAEERDYLTV